MVLKNLKNARNNAGYTQKELSSLIDIDSRTYQKYESGVYEPDIATLIKLSTVLNTTIDYIVGKTDNINLPDDSNITINGEPLSIKERHHLMLYRIADSNHKKALDDLYKLITIK